MRWLSILQLSWKNIWRNYARSLVVMTSVVLGIWAALFMVAFMNGMMQDFVDNQLKYVWSHLQIHNTRYEEEHLSSATIAEADTLSQGLLQLPFVQQVAQRTVVDALVSSARASYGVTAKGITPDQERRISSLDQFMIKGSYLNNQDRQKILIGSKLAKRLMVDIDARIVLNTQDIHGTLTAGAFRVSGIFHSPDAGINESVVFVPQQDLGTLILDPEAIHEIAMLTNDYKSAHAWKAQIPTRADVSVKSWQELSPTLLYTDEYTAVMLYVLTVIILIALGFGIINTMLMAVIERTAELGMLMAIGLSKVQVFAMILFETILLTLVGAPIGMLLTALTLWLIGDAGINLSAFAQGLELYGMSTIVHPVLPGIQYLQQSVMVVLAACLAALFPAIKTLQLNPVQAIRKR
jgi:ABC-type lipoprotein release transport system permease subunit